MLETSRFFPISVWAKGSLWLRVTLNEETIARTVRERNFRGNDEEIAGSISGQDFSSKRP